MAWPKAHEELRRFLVDKLNRMPGPVRFLIPEGGVSGLDAPGKPFHDPAADEALFGALKAHLRAGVPVIDMDANVNDPAFADACANALLANIAKVRARRPDAEFADGTLPLPGTPGSGLG